MKRILLVDDEVKLLKILRSSLEKKGYSVHTVSTGHEARQYITEHPVHIVFLDMMLQDTTGLELLRELQPLHPYKLFVVMTAFGNIESAVTAMKAGAFDYITKPAKLEEMVLVIERGLEWLGIKEENAQLKKMLTAAGGVRELVGNSLPMQRIFQLIERVADTNTTLLLEGESGTGKSMIAKLIHQLSDRSEGPFIAVNCAAIPEQLLESELFGYEKGAFTGAVTSRLGKFEAANGGTIFLDEVGDISASLQAKLLQVTQEKTFMRLGSNVHKQVDVRIISATNRGLKKMVEQGTFREDLYYRLNIVDIHIPAVRERKEDVPLLIEHFMERHRQKNKRNYQLSKDLLQQLTEYAWPGNVREIENAIERAVVLCRNNQLSIEDFPREVRAALQENHAGQGANPAGAATNLPDRLDEIERKLIQQAMRECDGQAATAARKLGISRQSLLYKLNKYNVKV